MSQFDQEPELSPAARRIVGALLLSLGLHAAVVGLIGAGGGVTQVTLDRPLQARLVVRVERAKSAPVHQVQPTVTPDLAIRTPALKMDSSLASAPTPTDATSPAHVPAPANTASAAPLPLLTTPPLADVNYYTTRELDVLPRPQAPIVPLYPQHSNASVKEGWVLLTLKLDDTGQVQSLVVKEAYPPDVFDQSALNAFRAARFYPGEKDGRPVNSEVEIKVWFH